MEPANIPICEDDEEKSDESGNSNTKSISYSNSSNEKGEESCYSEENLLENPIVFLKMILWFSNRHVKLHCLIIFFFWISIVFNINIRPWNFCCPCVTFKLIPAKITLFSNLMTHAYLTYAEVTGKIFSPWSSKSHGNCGLDCQLSKT